MQRGKNISTVNSCVLLLTLKLDSYLFINHGGGLRQLDVNTEIGDRPRSGVGAWAC